MTTAFNLSQLANNLDTSGKLDATDGLVGAIPVANGGTGASTLTTNNVILGNGTNAVQFVAPSTNGNVLTSNGTTWTSAVIPPQLTRATAQNSTSGTLIDFTSIPSTTKRITIILNGVSTNGTSNPVIQLGDSGGIETTGYTAKSSSISGSSVGETTYTNGFAISGALVTNNYSGNIIITNISGNTWICSGIIGTSATWFITGTKTLSAVLDRVRITTLNGTDSFDAGSINIMYE